MFIRSILILISVFTGTLACAQLNAADSLYFSSMKSELNLNLVQQVRIDSVMKKFAPELTTIEKDIQRASRSSVSQTEKDSLQNALIERKKTLKSEREASIRLLLSAEQNKQYDEKIKPAKPAVIHMGINHDRMNCTVCLPK